MRILEVRRAVPRVLCGVFALGLLVGGCRSAPDLKTPPEIHYGEDTCDHCRMRIEDPRFAAASITRRGRSSRFDDIGDMAFFHASDPDVVATFWVHDYDSEGWIPAVDAFFAVSKEIATPMGHGVAAFGADVRARETASERDGTVLTFRELLALVGRKHSPAQPLYEIVRRAGE